MRGYYTFLKYQVKVEDVLSVGDEVTVKVSEIDNQGRINLNMKDLEAGNTEEKE